MRLASVEKGLQTFSCHPLRHPDGTIIEGLWLREIQNDTGMINLKRTPRKHAQDINKIETRPDVEFVGLFPEQSNGEYSVDTRSTFPEALLLVM